MVPRSHATCLGDATETERALIQSYHASSQTILRSLCESSLHQGVSETPGMAEQTEEDSEGCHISPSETCVHADSIFCEEFLCPALPCSCASGPSPACSRGYGFVLSVLSTGRQVLQACATYQGLTSISFVFFPPLSRLTDDTQRLFPSLKKLVFVKPSALERGGLTIFIEQLPGVDISMSAEEENCWSWFFNPSSPFIFDSTPEG